MVRWSSDEEVSDYLDLIAFEENKCRVWEEILKRWREENLGKILLRNIPEKSQTLELIEKLSPRYDFKVDKAIEDVAPYIKLPKTFNEYLHLLTRKDRHELRRKMRRIEKFIRGNWTVKKSTKETIDPDLETFFKLFRLGVAPKREFLTKDMEEFFRKLTKIMQELGMLDLSILKVKDKPAAAIIGFFDNKAYYLYNSALDVQFKNISAGLILKVKTIRESIEKGREIYDFMQGGERYKYQLGGQDAFIYKVALYRR